jgi:hypothetical protein
MPAQTDRVKGCIAGVIAPAIVFEPGFMDGKEGAIWLPHNTEAIGKALAAGVIRWAKEAKIG